MPQNSQVFSRDRAEFNRGLSFFDAVYAFALTFLVANIDLPPAEAWQSVPALLDSAIMPQLLGFLISFFVIALFWKNNTDLVSRFRGLDGPTIGANLVTVGFVVLIPFTTQGISDPLLSDLPLPTALYASNVALAIASAAMTIEVGRSRGLDTRNTNKRLTALIRLHFIAQIGVFLVSIPVAFLLGSSWGRVTWIALVLVRPVFGKAIAREEDTMSVQE